MPNLVAIDIQDNSATVVEATFEPALGLKITGISDVKLGVHNLNNITTDESQPSASQSESTIQIESSAEGNLQEISATIDEALLERLSLDADSVFVITKGSQALYSSTMFPFEDQKKIEQIVPLQIQDVLPFEVDTFVVDSVVVGAKSEKGFPVVSCLTTKKEVTQTLKLIGEFHVDPQYLTSRASAVSLVAEYLSPEQLKSTALIELSLTSCVLVIFVDGKPVHFREFPLNTVTTEADQTIEEKEENRSSDWHFDAQGSLAMPKIPQRQTFNTLDLEFLSKGIVASLSACEVKYDCKIDKYYIMGSPELTQALRDKLKFSIETISVSDFVVPNGIPKSQLDTISWAIGCFGEELFKKKKSRLRLFNLRKGEFAYQPTWKNLFGALKNEMLYLLSAPLLALLWLGYSYYATSSHSSDVELEIKRSIAQAMPGEFVPFRNEIEAVSQKVSELEEQLRIMGSLSSLSPIDTLKELSTTIPSEINIDIVELRISSTNLSFRGSLPDQPSAERLTSTLEGRKNLFCDVQVNSSREAKKVTYSAEVVLCE